MKSALAFDIGGTKIAAAVISEDGKMMDRNRYSTDTSKGPSKLVNDLSEIIKNLINKHSISCIGISSAGPLDTIGGQLINPTNMKTDSHSWGMVPLVAPLKEKFDLPIILENDAAAAVVGESWKGSKAHSNSILSMTLGTGIGIGAIVEGRLQRVRSGFHTEVSHTPLNYTDKLAPCGCGNFGCIEAYLSGLNFPQYFARRNNLKTLTGKDFVEKALNGDRRYLEAFQLYSEFMSQALHTMVLIYSPEYIIFSGSFSSAFQFFEKKTIELLEELLRNRRQGMDFMPSLSMSKIPDDAGLFGAAKMAFHFPKRL